MVDMNEMFEVSVWSIPNPGVDYIDYTFIGMTLNRRMFNENFANLTHSLVKDMYYGLEEE